MSRLRSRGCRWFLVLGGAVLVLGVTGALPSDPPKAVATFEAQFVDGGTLRLQLNDADIDLQTPYGKLAVPLRDIVRIDCSFRISEETAQRIDAAIADLGHADSERRDRAGVELLIQGEAALPALLEVGRNPNIEVRRRADLLITRLRATIPADRLEIRPHDIIQTEHSRIAGRITTATLNVRSAPFGDLVLKVSEVRSLRLIPPSPRPAPVVLAELENAIADPGHLLNHQAEVGKSFLFKVTGAQPGSTSVFGTDIYTTDSSLALAAVHAGVLRPGQAGLVKVTMVGPQESFAASTRNGVTSNAYRQYAGYRIDR